MDSRTMPKIMVRIPPDLKEWLMNQARENASSQASEIVRAVRERMKRTTKARTDAARH
jgi:Arc/MetJ-type ribon-helix-helix transcriptional regulator